MEELSKLTSTALLARTRALVREGWTLEATLIEHLGEVDARKLYLEQGYASMFVYCVEVLHFSESAAYRRIRAGRVAREFPAVLQALRNGDLHVTAVALIAPRLTAETCAKWIARTSHCTRAAIQEILAECEPHPEKRDSMQRLPEARAQEAGTPKADPNRPLDPTQTAGMVIPEPSPVAPSPVTARPPHGLAPMGAQRYRVSFTADASLHAELRELRALMRHQVPDGDLGEILAKAVSALLIEVRRQRFAEVGRPRSTGESGQPATRHIPAGIRRTVFRRDEGRCAYISPSGRRCGAREFLEFHHLEAWARERVHTVEGISLRCRAHNQHAERERALEP